MGWGEGVRGVNGMRWRGERVRGGSEGNERDEVLG